MDVPDPLEVSDETVRALLDEQFPQFAEVELGRRYALEDHVSVRIGDHHGAIFPLLAEDAPYYERSATLIAPHAEAWTFPASYPIATGRPGHGYPYPWVLVDWVTASTAGFVPLRADAAEPLGDALQQLHVPAPDDAPRNPKTSLGLAALQDRFDRRLAHAVEVGAPEGHRIDADRTRECYAAGRDVAIDTPLSWTHGRLEPRAILSDLGVFTGILLWHNFGAGDPAADIGSAVNLIPMERREGFWRGYGEVSPDTAARATAYQVLVALRYIEIDDPFLVRIAWERLMELGLVSAA